jgi:hypothetical protein
MLASSCSTPTSMPNGVAHASIQAACCRLANTSISIPITSTKITQVLGPTSRSTPQELFFIFTFQNIRSRAREGSRTRLWLVHASSFLSRPGQINRGIPIERYESLPCNFVKSTPSRKTWLPRSTYYVLNDRCAALGGATENEETYVRASTFHKCYRFPGSR